MSAQIISLPARGPILLTKKQLAAHLCRSERWIELKVRDGMPVEQNTDRHGRRRYDLQQVERWLKAVPTSSATQEDRLDQLERMITALAAQVADLRRAG
jgi:phage terminase Nu1 subunit (DNA packaging protein)